MTTNIQEFEPMTLQDMQQQYSLNDSQIICYAVSGHLELLYFREYRDIKSSLAASELPGDMHAGCYLALPLENVRTLFYYDYTGVEEFLIPTIPLDQDTKEALLAITNELPCPGGKVTTVDIWHIKRDEIFVNRNAAEEIRRTLSITDAEALKVTKKDSDAILQKGIEGDIVTIPTEGATWSDITITFIGDNKILVQLGNESYLRTCKNAGFMNKKNGKPVNSWAVMKQAARLGKIPFCFGNRRKVEKTAQDIRKKLRSLFQGISGDPVPIVSSKSAYQFAFKFNKNE